MNIIIVITTKDLPVSGKSRYVILENTNLLDELVCNKIMFIPTDGKKNQIADYLTDYQHSRVNDAVLNFLYECNSIPIFERKVENFILYVAPCISMQYSGGATSASHRYVAQIVEFAMKKNENCSVDSVYVFAHDLDLIFRDDKRGNNRSLKTGEDGECFGKLSDLPEGHVWVFQHEDGVRIYDCIIRNLSNDDIDLINGCKTVISHL